MLQNVSLANLPPYGKLFVGIFTTLMLFVCLWAVLIFYVEKGMIVDNEHHPESQPDFEHNVGLAHTHINGQTLLFFAIGLVFVFSSTARKTKKLCLWLFGVSVLAHVVGLTSEGYHWVFDDLLAVSGVIILVVIIFMAFRIFVDLGKRRQES